MQYLRFKGLSGTYHALHNITYFDLAPALGLAGLGMEILPSS